jgi:lipopolysaccharide biosynthesis glycosyltransferase
MQSCGISEYSPNHSENAGISRRASVGHQIPDGSEEYCDIRPLGIICIYSRSHRSMRKTRVTLACNLDDNYARHAGVMLHSVLSARADSVSRVQIYVLHNGLSEENKRFLLKVTGQFSATHIRFLQVPVRFLAFVSRRSYISTAAYCRVFLPYLLRTEKVLYLDCDLIVRADIGDLWDMDIADRYVAAVTLFDRRASWYYRSAYGLVGRDTDFFNSGVLLMNLRKIRKEIPVGKIMAFIATNRAKLTGDQDVLNAFFYRSWLRLPVVYNADYGVYLVKNYKVTNYSETEFVAAKDHAKIIHFTGPDKPWRYECSHPLKHLYFEHLAGIGCHDNPKFVLKDYLYNKVKTCLYMCLKVIPDRVYARIYDNYL